jgi:hypothetical protein
MSWDVVNASYRATAVSHQIDDLSKAMNGWADNFEKSLDDKNQATIIVTTMFTQNKYRQEISTKKTSHRYNVVNDGEKRDDFTDLVQTISKFALGNQNSFGVFVQMEEKDPPEWSCSIQERFLGCIAQERDDGYTRKKMVQQLLAQDLALKD